MAAMAQRVWNYGRILQRETAAWPTIHRDSASHPPDWIGLCGDSLALVEQSYTVGGCNVVAISSQTKHPEEAWEVLKFLVSEENQQREVFELGAGTALLRSVAFDRRHVYREGPPYDLTPILLQATKPEPQAPGWAEAKAAINAALTPVWNGQKSVRVAIDEVLPIAKAMLRQSK